MQTPGVSTRGEGRQLFADWENLLSRERAKAATPRPRAPRSLKRPRFLGSGTAPVSEIALRVPASPNTI
jgi:hypothetical protein